MTDLVHHLTLYLKEIHKAGERPLLVLCGPTASGKTALSLKLARDYVGEVISADSAQVYRAMDIGTAKVEPELRQDIRHHLIDIRDPDQTFTMSDFKREAERAIMDIHRRKKVPIVCGGTGLYINALVQNYQLADAPPDPKIREELQAEYEKKGKDGLYKMLLDLDPVTAARIHPNNVRYVARALEIVLQTKQPFEARKGKPKYQAFKIGIHWERDVLYERINARVDKMIQAGLLEEIQALLDAGVGPKAQSMSALGYKEFLPHLLEGADLESCKEQLKQNTRNFAKRQLTWFRKDEDIYWIEPEEYFQLTKK